MTGRPGAEAATMAGRRTRHELERVLATVERELGALEGAISHDLKAPLRAVAGFSALLERDCGESLSPEGREYLGFVRAGVEELTRMVDALLMLSRLGRREMRRELVDLSVVARRAAADVIDEESQGRAVDLVVGVLPPQEADRELVEQLVTCLLSNALKFTRPRDVARIEISGTESASGVVYAVRDNGVGFSMAQAPRLFAPFQRLHPASEFEGLGIGLAVVQRIARLHGGRVWVEAVEGEGAAFSFTLGETDRQREAKREQAAV